MTVGSFFKRALQFGAMFGVVVLGALIWRQSTDNSLVEACVFGLVALGVVGVGVWEIKDRSAASPFAVTPKVG